VTGQDSSVSGLGNSDRLPSRLNYSLVDLGVSGKLGISQGVQSGGDVGADLLAGFPPGTDGELVEVEGSRPSTGQYGDGSHTDLIRLGFISNQLEDNGSIESRVGRSCLPQLVDSYRAKM